MFSLLQNQNTDQGSVVILQEVAPSPPSTLQTDFVLESIRHSLIQSPEAHMDEYDVRNSSGAIHTQLRKSQ
jgi:hypothetical protein